MTPALTRRRLLGAAAATAALGLAGRTTAQPASDWPQRRYDAANTSYNPAASGPREVPQTRSLATFEDDLADSIVVSGDSLYAQLGLGTVSVATGSGEQRWSRFTADQSGGGLPHAVAHDAVYVLAQGGMEALEATSGDRGWRSIGRGIPVIAVAPDTVYVATGRQLTAFDTGGQQRWQRQLAGRATASAIDGETLYLVTDAGVAALDGPESTRWERELDVQGVPVVAGDRLYLRSRVDGTDRLLALGVDDGQPVWRADDLPSPITSVPATTGERVYVGAGDDPLGDTLYAVDAGAGSVEWSATLGNPTTAGSSPAAASPVIAGETVYVSSADGTVNAVDAGSGERLWRDAVAETVGPPVPADGRLYVVADSREIVALEESSGEPTDNSGTQSGQSGSDDSAADPDDQSGSDEGSDEQGAESGDGEEEEGDADDGSGPGFGVPVALSALGGLGYLLRRTAEQ